MDRRDFLAGASCAALLAGMPSRSGAWPVHGFYSAFNGGRSQAQSQGLLTSGDYPFINMMKTMQSWTYVTGGNPVVPSDLDSDGYPTVINSGGVSNILFLPSTSVKNGTYVMTWDGRGTVFVQGSSVTSGSFSNLAGAASGRCEFTPAANNGGLSSTVVGISAVQSSSDYPHNLQLFYKTEETALNNGQIFSTDYLNLLRGAKIAVMRFVNWQKSSFSNISSYAQEKPETFYSYYADEYRSSLYAGVTTGTGDAYVVNLGVAAPTDKQTVIVKFDRTATLTNDWTFSIDNGSTFYPIIDLTPLQSASTLKPASGIIATLVFDSDLQSWIKFGYTSNSHGLISGVPSSIAVKLCQKIGAHPYFVSPPLSVVPQTTWAASVDSYVRSNGPSWMIPRYETPNESWNSGYYANGLSLLKATAYWGTTNNGNNFWAGLAASGLGAAIKAARGINTNFQVLAGVQSATHTSASASAPRVASARNTGYTSVTFTNGSANISATGNTFSTNDPVQFDTVSSAGNLPSNISKNTTYYVKTTGSTITISATPGGTAIVAASAPGSAASVFPASLTPAYLAGLTHVCCTQYANPNTLNFPAEIVYAYQYLVQGTTSVLSTYTNDNTIEDNALKVSYQNWFSFANGYSLKLCGYEGGWSPDYTSSMAVNFFGNIVGATQANPCVLTINTVNINGLNKSGTGCVVGMPLVIDQVGGMTQLNLAQGKNVTITVANPAVVSWGSAHGFSLNQPITFATNTFNTAAILPAPMLPCKVYYVINTAPGGDNTKFTFSDTPSGTEINVTAAGVGTINANVCYVITAVSGSSVTINVDASAFSAYTSGGRSFFGTPGYTAGSGTGTSNIINTLRHDSKSVSQLQADTLKNYQDFVGAGGEFPSCFQIASTGNVWSVWDPDIFTSPTPPQWAGITQFNS